MGCVIRLQPKYTTVLLLRRILSEFDCQFLSGILEEYNAILEDSVKRRRNWQIKDWGRKSLLTSIESISFLWLRFRNKTTGRDFCLLVQLIGFSPFNRISRDAEAAILNEAADVSWQKARTRINPFEMVSRETAMSIKQRFRFIRKRRSGKHGTSLTCRSR